MEAVVRGIRDKTDPNYREAAKVIEEIRLLGIDRDDKTKTDI